MRRSSSWKSLIAHVCGPFACILIAGSNASPARAESSAARTAAPDTENVATAPNDDDRELRRILHLNSGQSIRVVSRFRDGRWEYKGKDSWKTLASAQVTEAALESEVLREWKQKRATIDATRVPVDAKGVPNGVKRLAERVELADWAIGAGLITEGLQELDGVLALDPDRADVLALLRKNYLMSVPSVTAAGTDASAAKEALLRWAASMPTAARELAVFELEKITDKDGLRADIGRELRSSIVSRRSFATLALRRIFPGENVKPLEMHAVLDPSDEVRHGACLALRAAHEQGLILPMVKALASKSPELRANAAEALGTMGYAAAVEPLVARLAAASGSAASSGDRIPHSNIFVGNQFAYIQDFDVEVAQFQAVADPQINVLIEGASTDAAVSGEQDVSVAVETATIRKSLERLTGASPGKTSKDWQKWWDANADKWRNGAVKTGTPAER